jgi:hypothetical protein
MEDKKSVGIQKLGGIHRYAVVLHEGENNSCFLDFIEAIINKDNGHYDLTVRGEALPFATADIRKYKEVKGIDNLLYEKAEERAGEKSKLHNCLFIDSPKVI